MATAGRGKSKSNATRLWELYLGHWACDGMSARTRRRSSTAGVASDQDELHQSGSHGEDVTQSPPAPGQRGQSEVETEVVIRSQWHASAEEPGEGVTQLAAHGIGDGKSLSQFWRAGDVGSIRSTAGLPISMAEFDNRRTVTIPQHK